MIPQCLLQQFDILNPSYTQIQHFPASSQLPKTLDDDDVVEIVSITASMQSGCKRKRLSEKHLEKLDFDNEEEWDEDSQVTSYSHSVLDGNKRIKYDGVNWDFQEPDDFYSCMENIEHCKGKAKLIYAAKEHECAQLARNQEVLLAELEQRDIIIEQQKLFTNELRKTCEMEIYKRERELFTMTELLDTYRKALKETRRQFSEYRKQSSLSEEPLYKDASPPGVTELKRHPNQEEEEASEV